MRLITLTLYINYQIIFNILILMFYRNYLQTIYHYKNYFNGRVKKLGYVKKEIN